MVLVNEHVLSPIGLPSHMAHPAGIAPAPPVFQTGTQTSTPQVEMEPPPGFAPGSPPKRCSRCLSYDDTKPSAGVEPARYSISSCSLCQLGYEGRCDRSALVGREGFAPPQQCGAFTERWAHSCPGRPTGAASGIRTLTACLEGRHA
jgi:hypothetical protein